MVVGIGADAGGAVGNGIGVVTIVGEGAGFKGVRVGTGVVVGSGADSSAAVGRGVGTGVTVGAEAAAAAVAVAGPSVAAGSRLSQAMPTVTASDRTPAIMRIAREGGVMEGITASVRGYQTRESGRVECSCWNYCGGGYPKSRHRGPGVPNYIPRELLMMPSAKGFHNGHTK